MTAETAESRLLHITSSGEPNRQNHIQNWLYEIGIKNVEAGWGTFEGPADLYLTNRRCIIEVKKGGRLKDGPKKIGTGSKRDESAYQQLERYILAERKRERLYLDDEDEQNISWLGIVTDGSKWWAWEWPSYGKGDYVTDSSTWKGRTLTKDNITLLAKLFDREVGKEWAPSDPTEIFKNSLESLTTLYEEKCDERDVITQRELWLRQLRISGTDPATGHEDKLFILHTLLIAVSTKISEAYGNADRRYGFTSWVKKTDWLRELGNIINKYNWKQQTGDVLRAMYMGLVDQKDRHIYGEYYTPDWLAEKMCLDIIDDKYIKNLVLCKTGGVMDPACGSGTFLYHVVRRIAESEPVRQATMTDRDITDMIVSNLYGIDIHPVAVAMAKANVLRALPEKPSEPLRIYQGDSLQTGRADAQERLDEPGRMFSVTSRLGVEIRFPMSWVALPDFDNMMHRFACAAVRGNPLPPGIDNDIDEQSRAVLCTAFNTLTNVCRMEGNDVWAWYIINQSSIQLLADKVSRIIANPPWVRLSTIQDPTRKREMESLARDLGLWAGGKNATGFNIAALFVVQCKTLYGRDDMVSGWVLPDTAMRGGNWTKYIEKFKPPVSYDLGKLAFPKHSESCVNVFGVRKHKPRRVILKKDAEPPGQNEPWTVVQPRLSFKTVKQYESRQSAWFKGKRPMARNGATIFPGCLVVLDEYMENDGVVRGTTRKSIQGLWRGKSYHIEVPRNMVRDVLFGEGLLPFRIGETRSTVLPIDDKGKFLSNRNNIKWWRDACDKYESNRGGGSNTPKTLEDRLDHGGALRNQFPISSHTVIYNGSGQNLYAARMTTKVIIEHVLFRVPTSSEHESLFLIGILNADYLAERISQTRKTDRHLMTYFWREVPIPRYNSNDKNHVKLVGLAKRAEEIAATSKPTRKAIKDALRDDGVAGEIDDVVSKIMSIDQD